MTTDHDYAVGTALLPTLLALLRERKRTSDAASSASRAAINAAGEASEATSEVVRVVRELIAALSDGAGHDGRHPLGPAITAAQALFASTGEA